MSQMLDKNLLDELITESMEHLAGVEPALLVLEEEDSPSPELINRIFRAMHSIKGGFGFFGLKNIQELSHKMESVLMRIRDGELAVSGSVTDALLTGVDKLRSLMAEVEDSETASIAEELQPLLALLAEVPTGGAPVPVKAAETAPRPQEEVTQFVFQQAERDQIAAFIKPGMYLYCLTIRGQEDVAARQLTAPAFLESLHELGDVVIDPPDFARHIGQGEVVPILFATVLELPLLAEISGLPAAQITPFDLKHDVLCCPASGAAQPQMAPATPQPLPDSPASTPPPPRSPAPSPHASASSTRKTTLKGCGAAEGNETLRVRIELLNNLMTLAGELVLSRNQIKQALQAKVVASLGGNDALRTFESKLTSVQASLTAGLGEGLGGEERSKMKLAVEREFQFLQRAYRQALNFSLIDTPGLAAVMQNVDLVTSELQNDIINTRMQPVGTVFAKFTRMLRDMAKQLGKVINLEIEGEEVALDKSIIERLGDPLTHLIRNCADHAIETPAVREAAGKGLAGNIVLRAYHEGGLVNIDVIDDGAGLNVEKIKAKALEKGQVTLEALEMMSEREVLALIFAPGLSTAEQVTEVSGRGVGMDVVKTNIEGLGGTIAISSTLGKGTKINLKLPLTLAIIPSLIVTAEERLFAVPQVNIEELVRINARDVSERIENVQGKPILRLREKLLPLVRLNELLGLTRTWVGADGERQPDRRASLLDRRKLQQEYSAEAAAAVLEGTVTAEETEEERRRAQVRRQNRRNAMNVLVLKFGGNRFGLVVERLGDIEEIVVKPLSEYLKRCKWYAGATLMGDGRVAMILDAAGLAEQGGLHFGGKLDKENRLHAGLYAREILKESQTLLLFANGTSEQFVLNLPMVARVEKVTAGAIERIGDKEFLKYADSSLRIIRLHDFLPVQRPAVEPATFFVIVPKLVKNPMGIVVHKLEDVIETTAAINRCDLAGQGIVGSIVHQGKMCILLDLYSLFEAADPNWAEGMAGPASSLLGKRVLLAEDTAFFRTVETEYLKSLGCEVEAVRDGAEAWEKLQGNHYDLLVTDIEMPKMDGVELTKLVRESGRLQNMPIIAVTALVLAKDRERIMASGVDAYEMKLDKEHLQLTMQELLAKAAARAA